jgi:hypothetical protein
MMAVSVGARANRLHFTPEPQTELVLVQNWIEELKARVPTK